MSDPALHSRDAMRALVEGLDAQLDRHERRMLTAEARTVVALARRQLVDAGNLADAYGRRGSVSRFKFERVLRAVDEARRLVALLERSVAA